jgi:hypothetical protein
MRDKFKLTKQVYHHLEFKDELTIEDLYNLIWKNIRSDGGFRLTMRGYELLSKYLDLESYTVILDIKEFIGVGMLLKLDRKLQHPYYIEVKKGYINLILFNDKEAMLANLYGDLSKFLDNYN